VLNAAKRIPFSGFERQLGVIVLLAHSVLVRISDTVAFCPYEFNFQNITSFLIINLNIKHLV